MSDTDKNPDQEKGDEILKRMLKTPPKADKKDADRSQRPPASDNGLYDRSDAKQA